MENISPLPLVVPGYAATAPSIAPVLGRPTVYNQEYSELSNRFEQLLDLLRPQSWSDSVRIPGDIDDDDLRGQGNKLETRARKPTPIYATPGTPDNLITDPMDANYLHFFVLEAPMLLLFTHHFPSVRSAVLELAAQNKLTLQSILAVSAQHADMVAGRKPTRALVHLSKCLPEIQNALTTLDINEGHITAVYCLTRVYYARRERVTARKHLHGLYLMFESYQHGPLDSSSDSTSSPRSPRRPSPLMMFLWRVAIQMDIASGSRGQALVFPPTAQNQDDFHRMWISRIASQESTEWALAEFALDDLYHHTLHLEKHAIRIRSSPHYNPIHDEEQIRLGVEKLWCLHRGWKMRNVVCQAERLEDMARQQWPSTDDTPVFLTYGPPLKYENEYFARMLMYHTERIIHIDIIEFPNLQRPSERRIKAAIELCRIIAGVGKLFGGTGIGQYFHALNNAGIVFNPHTYPDEFNWVVEKLYEVDRLSGYDSGSNLVDIFQGTWKSENPLETYRQLSGRTR